MKKNILRKDFIIEIKKDDGTVCINLFYRGIGCRILFGNPCIRAKYAVYCRSVF